MASRPDVRLVSREVDRLMEDLAAVRNVPIAETERWRDAARRTGSAPLIARANYAVGMSGTMLGHDIIAERAFREAAQQYTRAQNPQASAMSDLARAQCLVRTGRTVEALDLAASVERALATAPRSVIDSMRVQATAHLAAGDALKAVSLMRRAESQSLAAGENEARLAPNRIGLANALAMLGQADEAHQIYNRVLRWSRPPERILVRALAQYNLGCLFVMQGRWQQAFECFQELRGFLPETGNLRWLAGVDLDDADLHLQLNLHDEAVFLASRSIDQFRLLQVPHEEARALFVRAAAANKLDDTDGAIRDYRLARDRYLGASNLAAAGLCSCHIADIQLEQGHSGRAKRTLEAAANRFSGGVPPLCRVQFWELRARIALAANDDAVALSAVKRAAAALETTSTPHLRADVEYTRGCTHRQRGNRRAAARAFRASIDATEQSREQIESDALGAAFFEGRERPYVALTELQLAQPGAKSQRALFQTIGRLKSRLGDAPRTRVRSRYGKELDTLRDEVNVVNNRLLRLHGERGNVSIARDELKTQLDALTRQRSKLEGRIARLLRNQRDQARRGTTSARLDPEEIQRSLRRDEAFVEYFAVRDRWLALVCTKDSFHVIDDLIDVRTLEEQIRKLRFLVARTARLDPDDVGARAIATAEQLLARLGDALVVPLLRYMDANTSPQRLYVIPHGVMHQLPLAALQVDGDPWISRSELCVLPNRRFLGKRRRSRSSPEPLAVGLEGPLLPEVKKELRALGRAIPGTETLFGVTATREAFCDRAPRASLLHIATHAHFRADNPMHSALQLSDGWLAAWEIAQLRLHRTRLAVLSACESGRSKRHAGDELLGLARGFFLAGVPTLVASQWPLRDELAVATTRSFYRNLADDCEISTAFRKTLLQARKRHRHPAHWANATLYGCAGFV